MPIKVQGHADLEIEKPRVKTHMSGRMRGVREMAPLCLKFGAIPTIIYKVTAF